MSSTCEVHVGDVGVLAEHRACGKPAAAEVCPRRSRVYSACAEHAWEAEANDQLIAWFDGKAPPRPGYDDEDENGAAA